jgi:hypothetical protein
MSFPTEIKPLSGQTKATKHFNYKCVIKASDDFTSADTGTTKSFQVFPIAGSSSTFPAGTRVTDAAYECVTAFDSSGDSSINSLLMELGDGTDPNRFLGQSQLAVDGTEVLFGTMNSSTAPYVYLAADTLDLLFTVAGGGTPTIAEVDSGEVHVYFRVEDLNELEIA